MSGGHFDYDQRRIQLIIEKLEELIEKNGKKIDYDPEYSKASWENEYEHEYPEDIIDEFKNGLVALKKAFVYTQRIDWLVSGDDGEESFRKSLKNELKEFKSYKPTPPLWGGEVGC